MDTKRNSYVAFIRAINVAGHSSVKMSEVRKAFVSAGCSGVKTYIQSGNIMFTAPDEGREDLFQNIRHELGKLLGDEPAIFFRTQEEVKRIVERAPFKDFGTDSEVKLYVAFLSEKPRIRPNLPLLSPGDGLEVIGIKYLEAFIVSRRKKNGMYGFPNNFIEKELGVPATSRNWKTVSRIAGSLP